MIREDIFTVEMLINSGSFNLAPDDLIYAVKTDRTGLVSLLMSPQAWINSNAQAVLQSPFTITFYRTPGNSPDVIVEGVSGTGLVNIRTGLSAPEDTQPNPANVDIVLVEDNGLAYVHMELGTDTNVIADFLVSAVENPASLVDLLNQATQQVIHVAFNSSGQPVETPLPGTTVNFSASVPSLSFVYQSRNATDNPVSGCNIDYGTWSPPVASVVNVSLTTIAVKAY